PRLVTWGLFERTADGRRFRLFNTHLPYRDEDGAARLRGAELILQRLAALPDAGPVILVGDFNDVPDSDVHRALLRTLDDAWLQASRREGPAATFHAFTGQSERRIDWVLSRGLRAIRARTLTDNSAGRYPSDHFPVLVDFDWPESPL
ncbi:MAG TPA: endonuclease/exonuclease/phosphatase family protein, partial [Luteimonas sp.]|nr:endonuclease/exonuclease/phosphatase family protein [Luteimonas sp.]